VRTPHDQAEAEAASRRRLKGFVLHLAGYFVVTAALVAINLATEAEAEEPWFLLPVVGWGSVLALHAAYAMGLFALLKRP
jgi:hypothetical protein